MDKIVSVISAGAFVVPVIVCLLVALYFFIVRARSWQKQAEEVEKELSMLMNQRRALFNNHMNERGGFSSHFDEL